MVGQAELYPVLLARMQWKRFLRGRRVIVFIDNDSARQAFVKGSSPILQSAEIVAEANLIEVELQSRTWFSRVPTLSNVADSASRLQFDKLKQIVPNVVIEEVVTPRGW